MEYSAIDKFILTLIFYCETDKEVVKDKKEGKNLLYRKKR